ncbi:hypothetical protein DFS33DRAFT_1334763 [Desarmillaria ectypa]|nr:hypothetical protein DFS33DRAFT_1334763 [Desarmillaria ectypa]
MHECRACHWTFKTERGLHSHCRDKENHFYCIECRRLFLRAGFLEQHLSSIAHGGGGEDVLQCSQCLKDCRTQNGLRLHCLAKKNHHYCKECDKMFMNSHALRQHLASSIHC